MPGALESPPIVPELDVADLAASMAVYTGVFGFACRARRVEEAFAYLVRGDVHLMLQAAEGPGRRFRTAPLCHRFGRGINLQIRVPDVDILHAATVRSGLSLLIALEERWYRQGEAETGQRQFVVADPDGYLLRFFTPLGWRPAQA